jgi:hypothetical protein
MRNLIDLAETVKTPAETVRSEAMAYAETLGVQLELDLHERGELMLGIWRNEAPKGSGAKVMLKVNELADQHGVTIMLDVIRGEPKLVPYYWQFGYRGWTSGENDAKEKAEFAKYQDKWNAFAATEPDEDEYCVICMVREPNASPVA